MDLRFKSRCRRVLRSDVRCDYRSSHRHATEPVQNFPLESHAKIETDIHARFPSLRTAETHTHTHTHTRRRPAKKRPAAATFWKRCDRECQFAGGWLYYELVSISALPAYTGAHELETKIKENGPWRSIRRHFCLMKTYAIPVPEIPVCIDADEFRKKMN